MTLLTHIVTITVFSSGMFSTRADGVSEPGLILYGKARNAAAGNVMVTRGTIELTVRHVDGSSLVVTQPVTPLGNEFSFRGRAPLEVFLSSAAPAHTYPLLAADMRGLILSVSGDGRLRIADLIGAPFPRLRRRKELLRMTATHAGMSSILTLRPNARAASPKVMTVSEEFEAPSNRFNEARLVSIPAVTSALVKSLWSRSFFTWRAKVACHQTVRTTG
jgi:hypothetical protein